MGHDFSQVHGTAKSPIGGEIDTERSDFSDVHLIAEHVPERHDPDPHDKSTGLIDLPGMVNVYVVIDGGKLLLSQWPASKVLAAVATAKAAKQSESESTSTQG